ncbi:hypothetical protein CPLU01_05238 [Colletotrichum plurivorum]|uniref:F-box domain-containing protein n=1 Tax=Colletotrichum plurivorum TaxID=2175906 RepID=A0A8H6NIC0_9PEZI|nr:hypothetical protein CPLU01_05238 [Colletotrichum plurivorum]
MSRFLRKLFSREQQSDRDSLPWAATPTKSGLTEPLTSSFVKYDTSSISKSATSSIFGSSTATLVEGITSVFDNLERELLLRIIGHLELHDHFLLSHTCQTLRNVTRRDWVSTVEQLPLAPRLEFWAGIAFVLPNHWVCGPCYRLHKINKSDVPWKERRYSREAQNDACEYENGVRFDYHHKIEEKHVQLALKFTRLNNVNQDYLASIMKLFAEESFKNYHHHPAYKSFYSSPKIVFERFLLHTQWVFGNGVRFSPSELRMHGICPHMVIYSLDSGEQDRGRQTPCGCKRSIDTRVLEFTQEVRLALKSPGREFDGHCSRCTTDYSILVGPARVTISAWHDFGSYKSPEDESWTVHIESNANKFTKGPIVYHEPGSVRRLYEGRLIEEI